MSSVGDQIRMDALLHALEGKDISNLTIIFGTCEDCKHRDLGSDICDIHEECVVLDFCCKDHRKRGSENG